MNQHSRIQQTSRIKDQRASHDTKSIQKTTKTNEMVSVHGCNQQTVYREINMRNQKVVHTLDRYRVVERKAFDLRTNTMQPIFIIQKRALFFFWMDTAGEYKSRDYAVNQAYIRSRIH